MTRRKSVQFVGLLISQALLLVLLLFGVLAVGLRATPVFAASINVDDEGLDSPTCGGQDAPCRTIPYALANRAEPGDTLFVWPGTYTETVALRSDIVISGAGATRTFIDGEGVRGPMVTASGNAIDSSTALRGVTIRRGTASNGAGIHLRDGASPLIEDCIVSENVATLRGGGLSILGTPRVTLRDTVVISNTSTLAGGGMYQNSEGASRLDLFGGRFENNETTGGDGGGLWIADTVVITGTEFVNNRAANFGGGVYQGGTAGRAELIGGLLARNTAGVYYGGGLGARGTAVLSGTQVVGNRAGERGGGAWATYLEVTRAVFENNSAGQRGGGLFADWSLVMAGTSLIGNTAPQRGGGVAAERHLDIVNSLFARNSAYSGAAVWMWGSSTVQNELRHLTIVSPTLGSVYTTAGAIMVHGEATAMITNTIVGGYPYAIDAYDGGTAYEDYNLYYNLGTASFKENGGLIHSGGHSLYNLDPRFVDPSEDDYHLGAGSPAIEAGIDIGVTEDIDGDLRHAGRPPDIGADQAVPILAVDKSGPARFNPGTLITYTLSITNTGVVTAHSVTVTDTLPIGARIVAASDGGSQSGGQVSWPPFDVALGGGVVTRTFIVTAADTITNHDYLAAAQGYPAVAGVRAVTSRLNHSPIADAGAPQTVHTDAVTLDGSGSSDADGDFLLYHWAQTGGTPVTLSDPNSPAPTFTPPDPPATLTFVLTVTDPFDLYASDTTTVTVANAAPIADAGPAQSALPTTLVNLDGSGSSDPDGDTLLYHWVQTGGSPVTLNGTKVASPTFTTPSSTGTLTFTLTVTDPFGLSDVDRTNVTVALPQLAVAKSGPDEVVVGDLITYALVITNSAPVAASSLIITDALPTGATFVKASDEGVRAGDLVSWTVQGLEPGHRLIRTFSVTATETITNSHYRVSSEEGVSATGRVAVVTRVRYRIYLPIVAHHW